MTRDSFSSSPVYRIRLFPASTWTRVLLPWVNECHLHCCFFNAHLSLANLWAVQCVCEGGAKLSCSARGGFDGGAAGVE